jgi:hypothetical protein
MFVFLDNIVKLQATMYTYIKWRSTNLTALRSRHNSGKETVGIEKYHKYASGELSRRDYECVLSYTFQP